MPEDTVELRIHDPKLHPTLVYLPGLHGDWTIATPLAAALAEFLHRRTASDQRAMVHRLRLLAGNDPRPIAQSVTAPVYHLAGWFDPIVPAPLVRHWLQHHCPGFRGSRTLKTADHSVLLITAEIAARQILAWMQGSRSESRDSLPAP